MAFNPNDFNKDFDKLFGAGSFQSGLNSARNAGKLKVQAGFAKKDYLAALKLKKKEAEKKTYDDAVNYWNDPTNREHLLGRGPKKVENDYLNDPYEKERIKELGFTKEDYIDAMYNAASSGEQLSKRGYKQEQKKEKDTVSEEKLPLIPMVSKKKKNKKDKSPTQSKKKEATKKKSDSIWDDLKAAGKSAYQGLNPFDDVSASEAVTNFWDRDLSKKSDGISRGAWRAVDSAEFGIPSNLNKKMTSQTPSYLSERKFGEGGGTDMITTGLGYLVPGVGAYKALNASKLGKAITQVGSEGIKWRLAAEATKGTLTGAGIAGAEVGVREGLNPQDYSGMDNFKHVGFGAAAGMVADPLLYGAGKGIVKGFESSANRTMRNLLPNNQQMAQGFANTYKSIQGDQALPIRGGVQNPALLNDLIPRGNNITNPNFVPNLMPKPRPQVTIPRVGTPFEEALANPRVNSPEMIPPQVNEPVQVLSGEPIAQPKAPQQTPITQVVNPPNEKPISVYTQVKEHVMSQKDISVSNIQNKFKIGHSEAAKIIDQMEAEGIVGPYVKNKPREILVRTNEPPTVKQHEAPPQVPKTKEVPKQGETAKPKDAPPKKSNERSFPHTVLGSDKLTPEVRARIEQFDKGYTPMSNKELVQQANEYLAGNGIEKSYQFVKNANKLDPRHIAVGQRLIDELSKAKGQEDKVLDMIEKLSESGTSHGQSIQSFSLYNKLSVEGQLLRFQRHVRRINEDIANPDKQVKLSTQNVQDISHAADVLKTTSSHIEQSNEVIRIMDNVKKGKQATDAELKKVQSFVKDVKTLFGDLEPKAPEKVKPGKDKRTRDKVVDFMDKKEQLAREELRKIMGRANSLPVDAIYNLGIIGASKIAKGTVKIADFTEDMAKEFGDQIRPYAEQIYNKAVETFNRQSESMTRKQLSDVEKITNKALKDAQLDPDQAETIREFARQIGEMSGDTKLESSMNLQALLMSLEQPTFGRKLSAGQTIAQLLNPKTIVRNAIGNEMFYRTEQMNKLLHLPFDIAKSKLFGTQRNVVFRVNNQGQYWKNWMSGGKAGAKGINPMGLQTAYDIGPRAFTNYKRVGGELLFKNGKPVLTTASKYNPMRALENALGASLRSFDNAAYMRAYNHTLGEQATLRAVNEGLKGAERKAAIQRYIREADDNVKAIADKYAKYVTFQDDTVLAKGLTKAKKGMNKYGNKVLSGGLIDSNEFGLGDFVLKYPKTPGNIIMRALEYSPAGVVRSISLLKDMKNIKNPETSREFWLSLQRAITGTMGFSALGYALADKGVLTTPGSSDYEVASLERNAGKQPNSVNVSAVLRFVNSGFKLNSLGLKENDQFFSYDWAQPISIAVALGTGVKQGLNDMKKDDSTSAFDKGLGAAKTGFDSAVNTVINQSALRGVKDFLTSYPNQGMSQRLEGVVEGTVGSFVPTLSNQIRQFSDNSTKSTYSPNLLPTIKNKAINRIPGAELKLPAAYDTLGNKRETFQGGSNNLLNVFFNPAFMSKYKPSAEAQFVLDTIKATGDKNLAPHIAQKKLDGKPLTSKQYSEMQRIMGEEVQKGLKGLSQSANSEQDAKAIEKILRDAGKVARSAIREERGN